MSSLNIQKQLLQFQIFAYEYWKGRVNQEKGEETKESDEIVQVLTAPSFLHFWPFACYCAS